MSDEIQNLPDEVVDQPEVKANTSETSQDLTRILDLLNKIVTNTTPKEYKEKEDYGYKY